jgi:hypothetical protein
MLGGALWAAQTPNFERTCEQDCLEYYPGWIEDSVEAKFFSNQGHIPFLHEQASHKDVLGHVRDLYASTLYEEPRELGDLVAGTFSSVREGLQKGGSIPGDNLDFESVHIGSIALAAVFSDRLSLPETEALSGLPLSDAYASKQDFMWGEAGIAANKFPQLFAFENDSGKQGFEADGRDRPMHMLNHFYLVFEYLYGKYFGLEFANSVPNGLRTIMQGDMFSRAQRLSHAAGLGYELLSTFSDEKSLRFWDQSDIREGVFDPEVLMDIKANILGMNVGIWVFENLVSGKSLEQINTELHGLNSLCWRSSTTEPKWPPEDEVDC